ncbi:MAG: hypothetical protein ACK4LQ_13955 [Pararhodobacter sp.]
MHDPLLRIARDAPQQHERAIAILSQAFARDPALEYFTQPAAPAARPALRRRLIASLVRMHLRSGHSLWGWQDGEALIGCALVEDAAAPLRRAAALLGELPALLRLPVQTLRRLNAYGAESQRRRPPGTTVFLAMIGLCDSARGQGHGAGFMRALHDGYGTRAHWALDTENADNLAFYQRLGYQLYATETLGPVRMFKMQRSPAMPLPEPEPESRHENQP